MKTLPTRTSVLRLAILLPCLSIGAACATPGSNLALITHAAFFSQEMNMSPALDPQVFVQDASAPAGMGPQNINHVAGVRNALLADAPGSPLYNASGKPLPGVTLRSWLGARGSVTVSSADAGGDFIVVTMHGLIANGAYSLFENHFDKKPVTFTPLDGTGTSNSFVADASGNAAVTVKTPDHLTHDNAVLVIYQSDGKTHGTDRGTIGITAHHQLISRIPE